MLMVRFSALIATLLGVAAAFSTGARAADGNLADAVNRKVLRVCSQPENLPFSNDKDGGFENKIAKIVADELKVPIEYTWWPAGTGMVRMTLVAKRCDLLLATVQADEFTLNTNHYYRTTYSLIYKPGSPLEGVTSLFDPKLKGKKVGVQAGSAVADYVAKAGLMPNAKSYLFIVDPRYQNPPKDMVADIRSGEVDAGVLWGPLAGYYANHDGEKLVVVPLLEEQKGLPKLEYRITMGVRANESNWKRSINEIIKKRQGDIDAILLEYGVPLVGEDNKLITAARK